MNLCRSKLEAESLPPPSIRFGVILGVHGVSWFAVPAFLHITPILAAAITPRERLQLIITLIG